MGKPINKRFRAPGQNIDWRSACAPPVDILSKVLLLCVLWSLCGDYPAYPVSGALWLIFYWLNAGSLEYFNWDFSQRIRNI